MPREENLYQRGKTWWFRAIINNVEYRESLRTSDVKLARRLRDKKLEELKLHALTGERKITWMEAVVSWAEHTAGQLSPTTRKRYIVSFKQCEPWLKPKLITEIDGKLLTEMMAARKKAGASITTIRRDLTAVSRVLEYAEAMEWREGNPTLSKRRLYKERRDPIVLPEQEHIEKVIETSSNRFGALIRAAVLTGCRQDELVHLCWRDLDSTGGTLRVIKGKGNKTRTVDLSEEALAHLMAHPPVPGSDLILCTDEGTVFANPSSNFAQICRRIEASTKDFKRFRFHDLRHLYAVRALIGGMDLWTLSRQLGHSSVRVTEVNYLRFLTPTQADQARQGRAQNRAQLQRFADGES